MIIKKNKMAWASIICIILVFLLVVIFLLNKDEILKDTSDIKKSPDISVRQNAANTVPDSKLKDENPGNESVSPSSSAVFNIDEITQTDTLVKITTSLTGLTAKRCNFVFTSKDSRPVIRESIALNGTCPAIEIPNVEFDKLGNWTLNATAYSTGESVVATKELVIN